MTERRNVFASVFCYPLAKLAGARWKEVILSELANPLESDWPGIRTIGRLRDKRIADQVFDLANGATLIAKARSKAAGQFLRSDADVWVTVDDDVEIGQRELALLVDACRTTRGIISAPCLLRGFSEAVGNFALEPGGAVVRGSALPWRLLPIRQTGFGLCALHREAVERIAEAAPMVTRGAAEGEQPYPALFLEFVDDGQWITEDSAFSLRARDRAAIYALCDVEVWHAGRACRLQASGDLLERAPIGATHEASP